MEGPARIEAILIVLVLAAGYFCFNNVMGLRAEEPRRAVVGIEALLGDNALVPAIHGEPYYNKPPVYNWVLAGSFLLLDSFSPAAVRLPGVLSLWLIAAVLFFLVKKYLGRREALASSVIFLTFGDLLFYGAVNAGEIDLFYSLIVFLQVAAVFHFYQRKKLLTLFLVSYFLAAVGALTKGLPSVAFQGLTIVGYLSWQRDWKALFSLKHLAGILLFVLTVGGYFWAYAKAGDAIAFMLNLWSESSTKSANEAGAGSIFEAIYSFPLQLIQITLPWCLFALWSRRIEWKKSPLAVFSMVFVLANIWLYWISPEIRNRYLYVFFPFLAILVSLIVVKMTDAAKFDLRLSRTAGGLSALVGTAFLILPHTDLLSGMHANTTAFSICGIIFVATAIFRLRVPVNGFLHLAFTLAFLRLAYNICILPVQAAESKSLYYSEQVEEMLKTTGDEAVFWTGRPYQFDPELALAGHSFASGHIETPPLLAYQIPYYYSLQTNSRLLYSSPPKTGSWLLGEKNYALDQGGRPYYEFKDKWTQLTLVLYKVEKP